MSASTYYYSTPDEIWNEYKEGLTDFDDFERMILCTIKLESQ